MKRVKVPLSKLHFEIYNPETGGCYDGITPEGIHVDTLKTFLSDRKRSLSNFPLRTKTLDKKGREAVSPDFKEETLQALLGRFGKH